MANSKAESVDFRCGYWQYILMGGKNDERTRFVAVLGIPPVDSAKRAVQVQIVKDAKEAKK